MYTDMHMLICTYIFGKRGVSVKQRHISETQNISECSYTYLDIYIYMYSITVHGKEHVDIQIHSDICIRTIKYLTEGMLACI